MTVAPVEDARQRYDTFRKELDDTISHHRQRRSFDSALHQILIIGAALSGFLALAVGLIFKDAMIAGILGAVPSVATILSQQLHCVKAQNWHERMATEAEGIRTQLDYETKSAPTTDDIAALAKQLRTIRSKMTDEWEKVTSSGPIKLGAVKPT